MVFCDLLQTFQKQVTNVYLHVFVILLRGILTSPLMGTKGRRQNTQQRVTKDDKRLLASLQNSAILLVCKSMQRFDKSCLQFTKRH